MRVLHFALVLQLAILSQADKNNAAEEKKDEKKELIMLEIEPVTNDERLKRSSEEDAQRFIRQSAQLPPEYLGLLQQLSAQQQQTAGSPQQQQYIQELVVAREGQQQVPQAARYILSHDGRLLEQNVGLQALGQAPQQPQQEAPQPGRPILSPELEAFSRLQMQLQQDYHDAPIRAQIAGLTTRVEPTPSQQPTPSGPNSQAPQVFTESASQAAARHQERLRAQLQAPSPLVYGSVPELDAQTQGLLQQQFAAQLAAGGQPEYYASQTPQPQLRPVTPPPQLVYQQPRPDLQQKIVYQQPIIQPQTRKPAQLAPSSQAQLLPQNLAQPQQYLVETTRPGKPQSLPLPVSQYVSAQPTQQPQQIQYVNLLPAQQEPSVASAPAISSLLQPTSGRGLFTPVKAPSRSSIFVSRAAQPKAPSLTIEEVGQPVSAEPEKVPVVRLPSPAGQRPLTKAELDALINAGFAVSPIDESRQQGFFKAKRQQPLLKDGEKKNQVVYQNHQDGVSYQYSPGGGPDAKPRKATFSLVPGGDKEHLRHVYRVEGDKAERQLVTYVLALGNAPSEAA